MKPLALSFLTLTLSAGIAPAALISINLSSASTALAASGGGVLGTASDVWNNIDNTGLTVGTGGSAAAVNVASLIDTTGAATAYSADFTGFRAHAGNSANDAPGNIGAFTNAWFADQRGTDVGSIAISGFNPGDQVTVAIFNNFHYPTGGASGFTRGEAYSVNGGTALGTTGEGSASGSGPTAYTSGVNTVQFSAVTIGASGILTITADDTNGNDFPDLAGLQFDVVPVPEPSSALLAGLGILGLLRRRR